MGFEEVTNLDLYLKIYGFNSYIEVKTWLPFLILNIYLYFNLLLGPLENKDVNNLVTTFISRSYKKNDIIL